LKEGKVLKKGFTLVELLIVMAIIAALMAVATPTGVNALAQAKATAVAANFRTLQQAVIQMLMFEKLHRHLGRYWITFTQMDMYQPNPKVFDILR